MWNCLESLRVTCSEKLFGALPMLTSLCLKIKKEPTYDEDHETNRKLTGCWRINAQKTFRVKVSVELKSVDKKRGKKVDRQEQP